jgi:hypothetical protein
MRHSAIVGFLIFVFGFSGTNTAQASGTWQPARDLNEARASHAATLLSDGTVLVTGGSRLGAGSLASAEWYDLSSDVWTSVEAMATRRDLHTATLLAGGLVLVAGGETDGVPLASSELYDPATGSWRSTGSMLTARYSHTATLLSSGLVLVAGGCCDSGQPPLTSLHSAELYDPATETWSTTGSLVTARNSHTATALNDGTVLVAGGLFYRTGTTASAERFDPASGTWSVTGVLNDARASHAAGLLNDGTVLVAGGTPGGCCSGLHSAELYDPVAGTWSRTGPMQDGRRLFSGAVLGDGTFLVAGGYSCCSDPQPTRSSAEIYDPRGQTWNVTGSLGTARYAYAETVLSDGTVLVSGGIRDNTWLSAAEIYVP